MTDYARFLSPAGRQLTESAIRRMGTVVARSGDIVSFAPGYPDPTMFPWTELRDIAASVLDGHDDNALQYGPTRGYAPLLKTAVAQLATRGITASIDELIITSGSQQGIDLIARVLVCPGDVVLVELPTFTGAIAAFRNVQADLVGRRRQPRASRRSLATRGECGEADQAAVSRTELSEPNRLAAVSREAGAPARLGGAP
jgi:2-aminoadipate transaminase